jgi:very-short-patch-repair endonuclease
MRSNPTDVEKRLWNRLRFQQIENHRFRRQLPVGLFVGDFACVECRLIIELDGGQHDWLRERDERRTAWPEAHGWRVLRFWNNDVIENIDGVLERIASELKGEDRPHPAPPPQAGAGVRPPGPP